MGRNSASLDFGGRRVDGQKFFVASFPGEEEVNFSIDPFTSGYPPSATATLHGVLGVLDSLMHMICMRCPSTKLRKTIAHFVQSSNLVCTRACACRTRGVGWSIRLLSCLLRVSSFPTAVRCTASTTVNASVRACTARRKMPRVKT